MEQPSHSLRTQMGGTAAENAPRRAGSVAIVTVIHIAIVALLILGMKAGTIEKKLDDIKASVEDQKVQPKPPPPPPPDLVKPPPPFVPPPDFQIQTDAPAPATAITTTSRPQPPQPPKPTEVARPAPSPPEPIRSTFTKPEYPTISKRLGETGTTVLKITVAADGHVSEAAVQTTSGSARLDQAAADWVKAKYRYKPATQDGKPVEVQTLLRIEWKLE